MLKMTAMPFLQLLEFREGIIKTQEKGSMRKILPLMIRDWIGIQEEIHPDHSHVNKKAPGRKVRGLIEIL